MEHGRLRIPVAVATLVLFALAEPVSAASQGALGTSSRGSVTITVSVRAPARIAGLGDFRIDGSSSAQNICFRGAAHRYTLAAQGSGPGGALSLSNGEDEIPYRVEWLSQAGADRVALAHDAAVGIEAVADAASCGSAPGAGQLRIVLASDDPARLNGAPYAGALLLTLAPE